MAGHARRSLADHAIAPFVQAAKHFSRCASEVNNLPSHIAALAPGKELNDIGNIIEGAKAFDCHVVDDVFDLVGWHSLDQISLDRGRANCIDGDPEIAKLTRHDSR